MKTKYRLNIDLDKEDYKNLTYLKTKLRLASRVAVLRFLIREEIKKEISE